MDHTKPESETEALRTEIRRAADDSYILGSQWRTFFVLLPLIPLAVTFVRALRLRDPTELVGESASTTSGHELAADEPARGRSAAPLSKRER